MMKKLRFKFLMVVALLFATTTIAFCQSPNFISWKIIADDLSSGNLAFAANETRTINYTVTVQRFLLPGGGWSAVDLEVHLIRIVGGLSAAALTENGKITSSDFGPTQNVITKPFIASLKTDESSTAPNVLKNNNEVGLFFQTPGQPEGVASNAYKVIVNATPPPVGKPAAPSNVNLTAIGSNEMLVQWKDNSNNEKRFNIWVSWLIDGDRQSIKYTAPANSTSLIVYVPYANGLYQAKVNSWNADGADGNSNPAYSAWVKSHICVTSASYTPANTNVQSVTASESITTFGGFVLNTTTPIYFRSNVITLKAPTSILFGSNLYMGYGTCDPTDGARLATEEDNVAQLSTPIESNILNEGVHIYPNPASEIVTIRSVPDFHDGTDVILMDMKSGVVKTQKTKSNQASVSLTVNDLAPGIYIVLISDGRKRTIRKVVIR